MLKEYVIILSMNIEKVNSHRFYLVMTFTQQYVGQHIIKVHKKNRSMYNPVRIDIYIVYKFIYIIIYNN